MNSGASARHMHRWASGVAGFLVRLRHWLGGTGMLWSTGVRLCDELRLKAFKVAPFLGSKLWPIAIVVV